MTILMCFTLSVVQAQSKGTDYPLAAEDAAWCWFSDPRAVYHHGIREQIYYGYINSLGDVVIRSKDMQTGATNTFVLHEKLQIDDHNVPSILILPDGRLIAFYTEHNGRFFMRRSKHAEDISAWEEERVIPFGGKRITYSHPVMLNEEDNRIYMYWRGSDWQPSYAFSDDFGDTWSDTQVLISGKGTRNRPYLKVHSDGHHRIDFIFTDGHPGIEPTNSVYHLYYSRGQFYQTNGDPIPLDGGEAIRHAEVRKVYDGIPDSIRAWIWDVALDKKGNPVIAYTRFPDATDHRYHYAQWNGKEWLDTELCKAGGSMPMVRPGEKIREPHYSGGLSLDRQDPSNLYLARKVDQVYEVEHWKKSGKRWRSTAISAKSDVDNVRPYVVVGNDGVPIVLWMTGVYKHYTDFDTDLRMHSHGR